MAHIPTGAELLNAPIVNKGTAFADGERTAYGLHGLLPDRVETLDQQVVRAYAAFRRKDDLERHIFLPAIGLGVVVARLTG